ncbi:MAG: lipase [Oscillospiraceae bacterium]|nr:lipase [Oscillospiraceae bacterium]
MTKKKLNHGLAYLIIMILFTTIFFSFNMKTANAATGNDYPIVFVYGFFGWGKEDMPDYNYWGGKNDILKDLTDKGFTVMSATIGAVSSDWDRACELYYYIKGGTVDYGAAHSAENGHARYGKTFPGIYPQWDGTSKIHLIGHSMGGNTIRLLVELLKNGDKNEQNYYASHQSEGISPLFEGGKSWVESITTLATPLNGATFANYVVKNLQAEGIVMLAGAALGSNITKMTLDLKLDQWGLKRSKDESLVDFIIDAENSNAWKSNDNALADLTTDGVKKLNDMTTTYSDIYYFSYNGNASIRNPFSGYYLPNKIDLTTSTLSSIIIGRYKQNNELPNGDKAWWKNDTTVSVISAQYPFGEAHKAYDGIMEKGIWMVNATMENWSHRDFIAGGTRQSYSNVLNLYVKIATNLKNLQK